MNRKSPIVTSVVPTIYLIRHAQDPDGFRGGWSDLGLTDVGISQSNELARFIKEQGIAFDTLLTSDLRRARATAEIVGQRLGLQVIALAAWRETNNGELAGMAEHEAREVSWFVLRDARLGRSVSERGKSSPIQGPYRQGLREARSGHRPRHDWTPCCLSDSYRGCYRPVCVCYQRKLVQP